RPQDRGTKGNQITVKKTVKALNKGLSNNTEQYNTTDEDKTRWIFTKE
ncbi:4702_t:CDS:1, partial [Gigaspora rosea]